MRASRSRVKGARVPVRRGSGGRRRGPEGPKSREIGPSFFRNGQIGGEVSSTFPTFGLFGLFEHFGPTFENYFQGSFLVLVHIVPLTRDRLARTAPLAPKAHPSRPVARADPSKPSEPPKSPKPPLRPPPPCTPSMTNSLPSARPARPRGSHPPPNLGSASGRVCAFHPALLPNRLTVACYYSI